MFLDPEDSEAFVTAMQEAGFDLRIRNIQEFVSRTRVFPFTHASSGLALDAVLGGPGFEEEFVRTARPIEIAGLVVPVIAPEELIVTKILAGRSKDLDDVQGILIAQKETLDLGRVRELLGQVAAAINQVDLLPCLEEQLRIVHGRRS